MNTPSTSNTSSYRLTCTCPVCTEHNEKLEAHFKELQQPAPSKEDDIRAREPSTRFSAQSFAVMAVLSDYNGLAMANTIIRDGTRYRVYSSLAEAQDVADQLNASGIVHTTLRELYKRSVLGELDIKYIAVQVTSYSARN